MAFDIASAANGAVGQVLGMALGGMQDKRQLKQQEKLQDLQIKGNKEMADYGQQKQMEMWENTNFNAQKAQMEKAGLNPALMYGMGGAGGATTGAGASGAVGGAAADSGAERTGMGLQIASQLALQKAQKENIEADTANKKASTENTSTGTEGVKIDNQIKGESKDAVIRKTVSDADRSLEEMWIAANERTISDHTLKEKVKQIQEDTITKVLNNKSTSIENRKKEAELAIKQFEATMAKSGLAPNTPWYVKMLTELAEKHGLNLLK